MGSNRNTTDTNLFPTVSRYNPGTITTFIRIVIDSVLAHFANCVSTKELLDIVNDGLRSLHWNMPWQETIDMQRIEKELDYFNIIGEKPFEYNEKGEIKYKDNIKITGSKTSLLTPVIMGIKSVRSLPQTTLKANAGDKIERYSDLDLPQFRHVTRAHYHLPKNRYFILRLSNESDREIRMIISLDDGPEPLSLETHFTCPEASEENCNIDYEECTDFFHNMENTSTIDTKALAGLRIKDLTCFFKNCKSLKKIDLTPLQTSGVKDISEMFSKCWNLRRINLNGFDTSSARTLSWMFWCCRSLRSCDISNFNLINCESADNMFSDCGELRKLSLPEFNNRKPIDLCCFLEDCKSLKTIVMTSKGRITVKSFESAFYGAKELKKLDLSQFHADVKGSMMSMFHSCESIKKIDLSTLYTKDVTDMEEMFCDCHSLNSIKFGEGFSTSNVKDMSGMFSCCYSLKRLDLSKFDTSRVRNMSEMFSYSGIEHLVLDNFDMTKVKKANYMFQGCDELKTISLRGCSPVTVKKIKRCLKDSDISPKLIL